MSKNKHTKKDVTPVPVIATPSEVEKLFVKTDTICKRCGGDKFWHSTKTGVRALTSSEPLVDLAKNCPDCLGSGKK
jgi:hypothetical protein